MDFRLSDEAAVTFPVLSLVTWFATDEVLFGRVLMSAIGTNAKCRLALKCLLIGVDRK